MVLTEGKLPCQWPGGAGSLDLLSGQVTGSKTDGKTTDVVKYLNSLSVM